MDSERTLSPVVWAAWLAVAWFAGVGLLWWGNRAGVHDPACGAYGTT
jgi:hypothetical protein